MRRLGTCVVVVALAAAPAVGAVYSDTFSYPDGNLAGNGGWFFDVADPGINAVEVQSGQVAVYAEQAAPVRVSNNSMDVPPGAGNVVDLTMDVKPVAAGGDPGGAGWFHVWDRSESVILGGLFWNNAALFGRNAQTGALVGLANPLDPNGVTVHMKFDFAANTVTFDIGGGPLGSSPFAPGLTAGNAAVGRVTFEAQINTPRSAYHLFDNLNITPEPGALGLLLLGLPLLRRRR